MSWQQPSQECDGCFRKGKEDAGRLDAKFLGVFY